VIPVSATVTHHTVPLAEKTIGSKENYKSLAPIPSPDGKSYRVLMFCSDHEQTLEWISRINQSGFDKAWRSEFKKVTILFMLPLSVIFFGLNDFRNWYATLYFELRYKTEFRQFLQSYDTINGSGMITYLWLSGTTHRPVDFEAQPDNTWVNNSWILDNTGAYIPNPSIWKWLDFWHFDFPPTLT
jgi:hypothetical protein